MSSPNTSGSDDDSGLQIGSATLSPEVEQAIMTDLAPAAAVALLAKADHPEEPGSPAMKCISAGVSAADDEGFVRVQFLFENGTVLPVDIPRDAAVTLAAGLAKEQQTL